MITGNQLCLAFIKYVFSFNNKWHYVLVTIPPVKVISFLDFYFNFS